MQAVEAKYERQLEILHDARKQRRAAVAAEVARRKVVEHKVDDLNKWIEEMADEVAEYRVAAKLARKEKKKALDSLNKVEATAKRRLELLTQLNL